MSVLKIRGGNRLYGDITVQGAKNSVLPIMAAAIVTAGETVIHNCPELSDVKAAIEILNYLGCRAELSDNTVYINSSEMSRYDIPEELMHKMRSSVIFLGAILARTKRAELSMPGGCELGPRPIDLHLAALRELGAEIEEREGKISCRAEKFSGAVIGFPFVSVGATENAMIAALGCEGVTVIKGAAREPEICDLAEYLRNAGAKITGDGTPVIYVEGTECKKFTEHTVIPDRIAAATYMAAAAAAGGDITLNNTDPKHLKAIIKAFSQMGCDIEAGESRLRLISSGGLRAPEPMVTRPYPGFPTDAQPPVMAACLKAEGLSIFVETIFENRYRHVGDFLRMGARIKMNGRIAEIQGVGKLRAVEAAAADLRGGAALAVAALSAEGTMEISGLQHIDRGYDKFEDALRRLGADAVRID